MFPSAFYALITFQMCLMVNNHVIIPINTEMSDEEGAGLPLYVTPFINAGQIEEGQSASRVGRLLPDDYHVSYSGFLTVNEEFNSNLFFWFCLSEQDPDNAPVLLWLNGGPGVSSLTAFFEGNGPYKIEDNGQLIYREYPWTKEFNVLFVDQPVGTGFSFTENEAGYARTEDDIARDMYSALIQFFQLFPEYSQNKFYLTGESYSGKYLPSIAYEIHKKNSELTMPIKINLKGCLIGNGFIDPENMLEVADFLYQLGFIDSKTAKVVRDVQDAVKAYARAGHYAAATDKRAYELYQAAYSFPRRLMYYYIRADQSSIDHEEKLFESDYVRKCIHVGNLTYNEYSDVVYNYLHVDIMQSVSSLFPELLDHYKILLYSGQLDARISHALTKNFIQHLHFSGAIDYYENDLILWYDEMGIQAGHYKVARNLTDLLVYNAGHMVPKQQPKRSLQMVREFINDELS